LREDIKYYKITSEITTGVSEEEKKPELPYLFFLTKEGSSIDASSVSIYSYSFLQADLPLL